MTMIQHRYPGDESEAAMTDERAAVRTIFRGQEFVDASDYDALRAENERLKAENASLKEANEIDLGEKAPLIFENTELSARVSELTRLLAEAEAAIRTLLPICDGDCGCEGTNLGCSAFAEYDPEERHMPAVQRALQSGEGKEPSR